MAKKPSLAEELDSLLNVAPKPFESDEEDDNTRAKVVDRFEDSHSDDEETSSFRKKNVPLLDEIDDRYKGKKVTREEAFGEESDSDQEDDVESEQEDEEGESNEEEDEEDENDDEDIEDEDEDDDEDDEDDEEDKENPLYRDRSENTFKLTSNAESEAEKGNCVKVQQKIWERLLEIRIKLQPVLMTSNKLPQHDVIKTLQTSSKFNKQQKEVQSKLSDVLDNLLDLQQKLLKSFPETKNLLEQGEQVIDNDDDDEEICSDTEEEIEKSEEETKEESEEPPKKKMKRSLKEYEKVISEIHKKYTPYRDSVIQKWNDKTRVASGRVNKNANVQSVVKQIEFVLNDKSKLIKRTQLKRSEYEIVGKKSLDETDDDGRRIHEYDTEIYDDDDFYHQLLRELIEQKTCHITDPVELSRQFSKLQSMRNKLKRKIDTRATKGRRIRYNVHPNLVNFMPSINVHDTWGDTAKTALYNSLFGKLKAQSDN